MSDPSTKKSAGLFGYLCICATIAGSAYFLAQQLKQPPRRLWSAVVASTNGTQGTLVGETRQLEFWTPSVDTKNYLRKEKGDYLDGEKWEVVSNDDTLLKFGLLLHTNSNVLGYRRVEVWGHGRSEFKPGWWWTMNVVTNYTASDLAHTYEGYWKSHQALFVEVIDNRGRDD